jgi:hypothetical protein
VRPPSHSAQYSLGGSIEGSKAITVFLSMTELKSASDYMKTDIARGPNELLVSIKDVGPSESHNSSNS